MSKIYPLEYCNNRYGIDSNLDIFNLETAKKIKISTNDSGYLFFSFRLKKGGSNKTMLHHRAVAITFISNPDNKSQVNHINGIKNDNRVSNLEWVTQSENAKHAWKNGLTISTINHKKAAIENVKKAAASKRKFKESEILDMYEMSKDFSTYQIAKKYKICQQSAWGIVSGKSYKEIYSKRLDCLDDLKDKTYYTEEF